MGWIADKNVTIRREPWQHELAYLAGIFDGEGSVIRARGHASQLGLSITMKQPEAVLWAHQIFSGRYNEYAHQAGGTNYRWTLQRLADLNYLLPRLDPYLRVKREPVRRLALAVEHRLTKPIGQPADVWETWKQRSTELVDEIGPWWENSRCA